jgi:hypothetical protein
MPKHDATTWKLPKGYEGVVGSANIEIEVRHSDEALRGKSVKARKRASDLLGHLLVSKGGLGWRPRGGKFHRRMNWEQFAALMEDR